MESIRFGENVRAPTIRYVAVWLAFGVYLSGTRTPPQRGAFSQARPPEPMVHASVRMTRPPTSDPRRDTFVKGRAKPQPIEPR